MIPARLIGTEIKFHRSGENSYFCLIDLKAFEVSTVSNDEGVLRIELNRTPNGESDLSELLQKLNEQGKR